MQIYKGVRILDLSRLLPGGLCTKLFADFGAEVIKVEEPVKGDYARWEKPFVHEESYYHLAVNGNKKSITLNLKNKDDREFFLKLVKESDVVFENFRPGVLQRLGIDYDVLKEVNPKIILCSMSGFGQESPYKDLVAHDINFLAMSGFLSLMSDETGKIPVPAIPVSDVFSALFSTFAISSALFERTKSGEGQKIDLSMYDTAVWSLSFVAGKYFADENAYLKEFAGVSPSYGVYYTKDNKAFALGAFEDEFWQMFCEKIERPDLIPYGKETGEQATKVRNEINDLFRTKEQSEWVEFFKDINVCLTPVRDISEVFVDKHVEERNLVYVVDHPTEGVIKQLSAPFKFSRTNHMPRNPAPGFGEHNLEIAKLLNK